MPAIVFYIKHRFRQVLTLKFMIVVVFGSEPVFCLQILVQVLKYSSWDIQTDPRHPLEMFWEKTCHYFCLYNSSKILENPINILEAPLDQPNSCQQLQPKQTLTYRKTSEQVSAELLVTWFPHTVRNICFCRIFPDIRVRSPYVVHLLKLLSGSGFSSAERHLPSEPPAVYKVQGCQRTTLKHWFKQQSIWCTACVTSCV